MSALFTQTENLRRDLSQQIREKKKVIAASVKKDTTISNLQQQLADQMDKTEVLERKSKKYKRQRIQNLNTFKKDPSARNIVLLVTKKKVNPTSPGGESSIELKVTQQIFRSSNRKKRPRSQTSEAHTRSASEIEDERAMAALIGKELRHSMILEHTANPSPITGLASYQQAMVDDDSLAFNLFNAMGTGKQRTSGTNRAFAAQNAYEQRGEMKAFAGLSMILQSVSDRKTTPLTSLITNILKVYRGRMPNKVGAVLTRIGLGRQGKRPTAAAMNQMEMDARIIMTDPELFSVVKLITDNVGFMDTKGMYKEYSMRGIGSYSPAQLVHWWSAELYIELGEDYHTIEQSIFQQQYPTPEILASPHIGDYKLQMVAEKARIMAAIKVYGRMLTKDPRIFTALESAASDEPTLQRFADKFRHVLVPTAYAAGVVGQSDECSVSLPIGSHRRRPLKPNSNIGVLKFNNIELDVLKAKVGEKLDVQRVMQTLQSEARIGDQETNAKYEPVAITGEPIRRTFEELNAPYTMLDASSSGSSSSSGSGNSSRSSDSDSDSSSNGSSSQEDDSKKDDAQSQFIERCQEFLVDFSPVDLNFTIDVNDELYQRSHNGHLRLVKVVKIEIEPANREETIQCEILKIFDEDDWSNAEGGTVLPNRSSLFTGVARQSPPQSPPSPPSSPLPPSSPQQQAGRSRKRRRKSKRKRKRKRNNQTKKDELDDWVSKELLPLIRKAAKTMGGRAVFLSDNAPAAIMAKLRDLKATGIIADIYSGGFHMLKKVLASHGLLFEHFVNDLIDPLRETAAFKQYYTNGSDPRQRWTEEPQLAMGHTMAMVHGYQQHLNAAAKKRNNGTPARKVNVNDPGEWKNVHDYVRNLVEVHGRISLVPMLFWLRCCDIASMLRSCGKALPSGDFELYRRLIRLCRILFALTNSMHYIRVNFDLQIFLETCNKIDYLIAKEIGFTGRTATNKPQFMDELQEKLVQIIRILSGGGAGGKRMSPMVESDMRPRVRDAEHVLHEMRTVAHELGVTVDATTAAEDDDHLIDAMNADATEQYKGQFLDDAREKLDEKMIDVDIWRNKQLNVWTLCGLQWAIKHGIYHPNPQHFVDNKGVVIPAHEFRSVVSGSKMSLDHLAMPKIGVEKLRQYCLSHFGEWIPISEQTRRRQPSRKRRRIDRNTNQAVEIEEEEQQKHGPIVTDGRFLGKPVREQATIVFNQMAIQQQELDAKDAVYSERRTTVSRSAIMSKKNIGQTGMKLFDNVGQIMDELNRVVEEYGNTDQHRSNIARILASLEGEKISITTPVTKRDLVDWMVRLRVDGVPCSSFLEEDGRKEYVKMATSKKLYYTSLDGTTITTPFAPLQQDFLKNTLCHCRHNVCTCEAVISHVQLCPVAEEGGAASGSGSDTSDDENEDALPIATVASLLNEIDRMQRAQRNEQESQ